MIDKNSASVAGASSPWLSLAHALMRRKRILIGVPVIVMALAGGAMHFMQDQYTATLKIAPSTTAQLYMWALRDNGLAQSIARQFNLQAHYGASSQERAKDTLLSHVQFVSNLQDSYVDVKATDRDPEVAMQLANRYGTGMVDLLVGLHLTNASNAIYELRARRELAQRSLAKARERLEQPDLKVAVTAISPSTRLGLVSMAGIEAETTLASISLKGAEQQQLLTQSLDQNEMVRLQERLAGIQRALADEMQTKSGQLGQLTAAISALQDETYWQAMIDRIDRRVEVLDVIQRNEIKLIPAEMPTSPSGPRRIMLTIAAGLAALLLTVAYVLVSEQFRRLRASN
ncbi:Wzz/FepE/Etk N-terminal domain-containing protein [Paraburkholderia madseniana]|nr:Wzz/FepE/Etk N-terminal domain-containing protein [Paraburkholderia sp. SECH4]MCX4176115.1 Wzz/FepE/Etk N-terminal domain-containing protein [Paraburkholderia madseniana]